MKYLFKYNIIQDNYTVFYLKENYLELKYNFYFHNYMLTYYSPHDYIYILKYMNINHICYLLQLYLIHIYNV